MLLFEKNCPKKRCVGRNTCAHIRPKMGKSSPDGLYNVREFRGNSKGIRGNSNGFQGNSAFWTIARMYILQYGSPCAIRPSNPCYNINIGLKHRTCAATPTNRHRSATCGLQVWAQCSLELYHGRYPEPVCTCCLVFRGPPPRILRSNLIQTESDCMEWYLIFALGTSGLCHKSGLAKYTKNFGPREAAVALYLPRNSTIAYVVV